MRTELPQPEEILEELADKTAAQIQRLAPVAFNSAFREMTRYHRFLLALSASRAPDGAAFNFAEVAGNAWHAPHLDWIRQYRRLFERAADRLADDDHFIRTLAYAPSRLLPRSGDPELSPNVVRTILDLGPILVTRLEAWVTKRTTVETREGQSAEPRLALAGSDAKAYASVLPHIVGAWESLLHHPPSMYGWREAGEHSDTERWNAYCSSWAFLWQHLTNTAYCLATAVWNEDEVGAALFREALVRWPQALGHRLDDRAELRHRRLLFPSHLTLNWQQVSAEVASLGYDYMPAPKPNQLFASVLRGAHDDVMLLTAALLLSWTANSKQVSDIGGRSARALLRREVSDDHHRRHGREKVGFRALFLDLLRFELAGERHRDGSYAADLDHLVATLDNMTERRVVPGRVFTPSTMHGRDDLLLSELAILFAHVPNDGDDGVLERITGLAREEDVLPRGDASLRDILHALERYQSTLEQSWPGLARGLSSLADGLDPDRARDRLRAIVSAAKLAIEVERRQRLEARAPDLAKLERYRAAIEKALLTEPSETPIFRGVEVGPTVGDHRAEWRDIVFTGIAKAQLLEPPMEPTGLEFEEMLTSGSREIAGRHAWHAFSQRPRKKIGLSACAEDEAFWREIALLIAQVGSDAVLVVSRTAEGRALRKFLYAAAADRPKLRIEQRPQGERRDSYIATIEGVDVFGGDVPAGSAWLFSAAALRASRYAETDPAGRYVELAFELGEENRGELRVRVRQSLEWSMAPVFELTAPDPETGNDA
jgi:hypothetical protein